MPPTATTAPTTTTTITVTTTTTTTTAKTVVTTESKAVYFPLSALIDGNAIALKPLTSNVKSSRAGLDVIVALGDITVLQILEPNLAGVTTNLAVRSTFEQGAVVDWSRIPGGLESPPFTKLGTVNIEIMTVPPAAPPVGATDTIATVEPTDKGTTLVVIIRAPGLGDDIIIPG